MATITINGTLRNDQTAGLQDNDTVLDNALVGLSTDFRTTLLGLGGLQTLTAGQLAFAASAKAAVSGSNYVTVDPEGGSITSLFFSDASGNLFDGDQVIYQGSPLQTVDGSNIYLWSLGDGDIVLATTSSTLGAGSVVAAFYLNDAADNLSAGIEMVTFIPIDHPNTNSFDESVDWTDLLNITATGSTSFDFDALRSGSSLWVAVGSASGAVLVSGHSLDIDAAGKKTNASNTIHTSQGGDGTTIGVDNQLFDNVGENAVFTLVTGFTNLGASGGAVGDYVVDPKPNDNKPEGIDYSGYLNVVGAGIYLSQSQGNDLKNLDIKVYEAGGGTTAEDGFNYVGTEPSGAFDNDTPIDVATVTVVDDLGHVVGTWAISPGAGQFASGVTDEGVTVTISGNTIDVDGLKGGYTVNWTVVSGETFNRFQVIAEGGQFDIGRVDIAQGLKITEPVGDTLFVDDDGPSVDLVLNGTAELRLDETDNDADDNNVGGILATNSLTAAAYLTTNSANFGADGEAGANPTVWSLSLTGANAGGVDSGLDDAVLNNNVMLFVVNSTTIVGKAGGAAGPVVLTISINATTGELTVTQDRAVEHNDSNDHDEAGTSSAMMNSGLVAAVRTITDGDGDSATDNVDVSQVIKLEDDGPDVELTLDPLAELRLDETDNDADDNNVGGILATRTITADDYLTQEDAFFGSDGQAGASPSVWSLSLTGANAGGVDSGLDDAVLNSNVMLFVVNSTTIVGRAGGAAGPVVLTISINATTGALTVTQERAVEHDDSADHDEAGLSSAMMNSGLVGAVRTITDGDGDQDSDSVDVSQVIKLEDDGPNVTLALNTTAALRLDETDADSDDSNIVGGILATGSLGTAAYLTTNTAVFGSDGAAGANPTVWSLALAGADPAGVDSGLNDTLSGDDVLLFVVNSTTIVGRAGSDLGPVVLTVTINATTGELTATQERAVEHDDTADHDEAGLSSAVMNAGLISAVRTITDGDGDHDSDSVDVSQVIKLEDDGPDVALTLKGGAEVTVDESTLPASDFILASALFEVNTAVYGSDGEGADPSAYKLLLADDNSLLYDTLTNQEVLLAINAEGTLIIGSVNAGADEVFRIELDPLTGQVTLTQSRALKHGNPADPDESGSPLTLPTGLVRIERTITDGDGDHDSANVDISAIFKFEDAGPVLDGVEEDVPALITDDTLITDSDTLSTDDIFLPVDADTYGSDGPNQTDPILYELRVAGADPDPDSGLVDTATGRAILLKKVGADIIGYVDTSGDGTLQAGETTMAIKYSLSGNDPLDKDTEIVTFTQYRAVVHGDPNDPEEDGAPGSNPETVTGGLVWIDQKAIDGDGDVSGTVSFDLGQITQLWDDGPDIGPIANSVVDFAAGSSATKTLNGDVNNDLKTSPYTITSYTATLTINGVELHGVLSSGDTRVSYFADTDGNGNYGDATDTEYYRLDLNQTANSGAGSYTFQVLVNPPPAFLEFDFDQLPSGANLFGMLGTGTSGLIVFGTHPVLKADGTYKNPGSDVIQTSQAGTGATIGINSQMFDPDESAYFTFVKNPDANYTSFNLSPNEADDADNMLYSDGNAATDDTLEASSAFLDVAQIQSGAIAAMNITAYNITGSPQGRDLLTASGQNAVAINQVKVYDVNGNLLEDTGNLATYNSATISVSFANGVATVTGIEAGYRIEWFTTAAHDQVKIEGESGKFDIGGFGITQAQPTPDQTLSFTATVTDGDGDTDTASWLIGIDGTGIYDNNAVSGVVI